MKEITRSLRISAVLLAGASLVACAPFLESLPWRPTPGTHVIQADLKQSIGYYENAVTAINGRHYALALEYLQAARNQKPDDVRVLTAFGVVYDKLGRFDLSARYYTLAASLDPKSRIVAADMEYSRRLQGISNPVQVAVADTPVQTAAVTPAEGTWPRTATPLQQMPVSSPAIVAAGTAAGNADVPRHEEPVLSAKISPVSVAKPVVLTGHPLTIVDASGAGDTDKSVRTYLSGLGWSVARSEGSKLPMRPETAILYKDTMVTAAKALARTLSLPMRLTAKDDILGLQLILGSDLSRNDLSAKSQQVRQRQLAMAAVKPKTQE